MIEKWGLELFLCTKKHLAYAARLYRELHAVNDHKENTDTGALRGSMLLDSML